MDTARHAVLPHHERSASTWGLGGKGYDRISFGLSDALAHAAQRLAPQPGEQVLDVATGTGWTARNVAALGARVTAVDISVELLEAAKSLSAHVRPAIEFRVADAESLPFDKAQFDRVISTFGVMFAQDQQQAAAELARVCKPGGRLVLTTWVPGGAVQELFGIVAKHGNTPPPQPSPIAWGDPARVQELLGKDFRLSFEHGVNNAYSDDLEAIWNLYRNGFGPIRQLLETLDENGIAALRRDLDLYHAAGRTNNGLLHHKREYLLVLGERKQGARNRHRANRL